ncbi:MAG: trehalose-phosphatase [Sphingobium sp.]
MTETIGNQSLPRPPLDRHVSLFLDLDGTLVDLIDRPDDVVADPPLRALLEAVRHRLEGRLAIVSGRSLAQLDRILGPVAADVILSGSHGTEFRRDGVTHAPPRSAALDRAGKDMRLFAQDHEGVLLEEKSYGIGLHYRMAPAMGGAARALAASLARTYDLFAQEGHDMVELRPPGHDKGQAIRYLMEAPPMAGQPPVFLGDDLTDETGFAVVAALGGHGVLVGAARPSAAAYRLCDPAHVRNWLKELSL